jgi:hypothetical protein
MGITVEAIEKKMDKGEALTPEETKFVMSMPSGQGTPVTEDEKDIDWGKAENADVGRKKRDVKVEPSPEDKAAEEAKKKKDVLAEKAKTLGLKEDATEADVVAEEKKKQSEADEKDPLVRIEREMQKPEGQEDLSGFTSREKAYFWRMRKDRKDRQKAEEERDAALFREVKRKKEDGGEDREPKEVDPLEELKSKKADDFMTVADVLKIFEKMSA